MWVPRGSGRSFRYLNSVKEKTSGPIALPIRTPIFASEARDIMWARGRLCLYYENNLLQSAVVRASITRNDNIILNETDPNSIDVDFVLTTSFQDLESRYATRSLEPVAETGDKGQRASTWSSCP